jgi:hypothetical protein
MGTFYKKPNGEVFEFNVQRMVKESCDKKFMLCDKDGKEIKTEVKKSTKKAGK